MIKTVIIFLLYADERSKVLKYFVLSFYTLVRVKEVE